MYTSIPVCTPFWALFGCTYCRWYSMKQYSWWLLSPPSPRPALLGIFVITHLIPQLVNSRDASRGHRKFCPLFWPHLYNNKYSFYTQIERALPPSFTWEDVISHSALVTTLHTNLLFVVCQHPARKYSPRQLRLRTYVRLEGRQSLYLNNQISTAKGGHELM